MKKTEKNGKIRGIEGTGMVDHGFRFADDNQQKPTESETHVHVSQERIRTINFTMYQAFQKSLFYGLNGFQTKHAFPDHFLFRLGKGFDPAEIFNDEEYKQYIQANGKRKYKIIVIHKRWNLLVVERYFFI